MDDVHQVKTLTEVFPNRWRNGQRDSVESLATVMAYARECHLYRKCGCATWDEFCQRYFDGEAVGFDELINGVRILQREDWRGPISEHNAREAARSALVAKAQPPMSHAEAGAMGGRGKKAHNGKNDKELYGTGALYRLGKLKATHPDIVTRFETGEFRSVAEAERMAHGETPGLTKLRRAWKRASAEERAAFKTEIIDD